MADDFGPWHKTPDDEPRPHGRRTLIWLALIVAGGLGIYELYRLFPGALSSYADQGYFMRLCVLLAVMASGIAYSRRFTARETFRNIAIWGGVVAALMLGYTFYHQIRDAAVDARSELIPAYPTQVSVNEIMFSENRDGDFSVIGTVNGTTVEFMVDTGATDIVLSPGDAERMGIDLSALHFTQVAETANGEGRGAPYTVNSLEIGPVKLFNVPVTINRTSMRNSLLGMAFLKRMKSFEMKGRKLYLRWR